MSIDVFISYRRTDEPWARRLYGLLNERGVAAWYDAHVAAGEDWRAATARALEAAPIFLLLYSKAASESDDITKELAAATFSKKQVIPVRLENIPPSGPFLYELASRNWIDAFTDTEAKLADLADRIAAQVKAAPATTQDPSPARPPWGDPAALAKARAASQASGRRRTLVAGAFAAGALLLAAAIWGGMALLRPAPPAKPGELTAFFGFLADPADPTASAIAKAATDETFQTMNAYRLETASRTRTQSVALADQLARARELGASYALGGEVRSEGAKVTLAMRLDDVETERTLWEGTVYGVPSESVSLPVLTASTAVTNLLECVIGTRADITRESERIIALLPRACVDRFTPTQDTVRQWTELAELAPEVASIHGIKAWVIASASGRAGDPAAALRDAKAAAEEAVRLDPANPLARGILASMALADGRPLAEIEELYLAAIRETRTANRIARAGQVNPVYAETMLLRSTGRHQAALPHARMNVENAPANPTLRIALALAGTGRSAEAMQEFEQATSRQPASGYWESWIGSAAFNGLGNIDRALAAAPAQISPNTVACWRDLAAAAGVAAADKSQAALIKAHQCLRGRVVSQFAAPVLLSAFGDLDGAFAAVDALHSSSPIYFDWAPFLYSRSTRPMRADQRFLPLMKDLGIWEYWIQTGTQPDVCLTDEERDFPFCVELRIKLEERQAQAK